MAMHYRSKPQRHWKFINIEAEVDNPDGCNRLNSGSKRAVIYRSLPLCCQPLYLSYLAYDLYYTLCILLQ
jgi:hypothetical protein